MSDDFHAEPAEREERSPVARDPRFLRGVERRGVEKSGVEGRGGGGEATAPQAVERPGTAPSLDLAGDVLPFRRTAVKPRRLRRSPWVRLLRPLVTALLVVALPAGLVGWVLTSPRFALGEIRVTGTAEVDRAWVEARLEPLLGRNLVQLPLGRVEAALADHPWIEGVAIRKQLPDGLGVEVRERRPAALIPAPRGAAVDGPAATGGEDRLWLADANGHPIVPAPEGAEESFVVVVPAAERAALVGNLAQAVPGALEVAGELARHRPVWAAALVRIEALGAEEYRVVTGALPFPLLVRSGELEPRAGYLEAALPEVRRRHGGIAVADLRFADRLILRSSGEVAAPEGSSAMQRTGPDGPSRRHDIRSETRREVG